MSVRLSLSLSLSLWCFTGIGADVAGKLLSAYYEEQAGYEDDADNGTKRDLPSDRSNDELDSQRPEKRARTAQ